MKSYFEPLTIKGHTIKNRLALAPMTTYSGNEDETPSQAEIDYIKIRSQDLGLIISPAISINDQAQAFENQMSLKADAYVDAMKPFVKAMQSNGGKAIAQLHHGGRMNDPSLYDDPSDIVSASAVKAPRPNMPTPRALTETEVKQTINDFAQATRRALEAGYDGIELHGANTYLLQQFFSPHSNQRTDQYGGSLENRLRFILEIVEAVHCEIVNFGEDDVIFGYRFSPEELEPNGITLDDTKILLTALNDTSLDYIHISLGHYKQTSMRDESDQEPLIHQLKPYIKDKLFIGSGHIHDKPDLDDAFSLGYDLMAIGAALISDPDFVHKIKTGQTPSRKVDKHTVPKGLYDRLYKNKDRFGKRGLTF